MGSPPAAGEHGSEFKDREVCCGVLTGLLRAAEAADSWSALFGDCGYARDHLYDPTERIAWSALQLIAARAGEVFSKSELRQIGASALQTEHFEPQLLLARLLLKPTEAYSFMIRGDSVGDFACISATTTVSGQRVSIAAQLAPGYGQAPALFELMAGAAAAVPTLFGLDAAAVELTLWEDGADLDVLVPPGGGRWSFLSRIGRSKRLTAVGMRLHQRTEAFETQISKRLTAEAHLRAKVLEHDRRMANISDVVVEIDHEGDVCFVSPNAKERIGIASADLMTDLWGHIEEPEDVVGPWISVADSPDGPRQLEINPSRYEDESGEGLVLLIRDVTDRFHLAEQLSRSRRLESLGVMASGVAHDFNNLLVPILANSSALLDELRSDSLMRRRLESIATAARLASDLSEQILATTGQSLPAAAACDAAGAVRSMRPVLEAMPRAGIELTFDVCDTAWAAIDEASLTQLVTNLVLNGIQSIDNADGLVDVKVKRLDDLRVQLTVEDNGRGMSEDEQERMAEPFFTTRPIGRGLGLASLAGLLQAGKVELDVQSTAGSGSRISVTVAGAEFGSLPSATSVETVDSSIQRAGTVLVVEDDALVRQTLADILAGAFNDVATASAPSDALAIATENSGLACVVVDLSLPEMEGPELVLALRRLHPDIAACLVTGNGVRRASEALAEAEVEGVVIVAKPFRPTEILQAAGESLEWRSRLKP